MNKKKSPLLAKLGSQKFIVLLVVIGLMLIFSVAATNFRKYTTIVDLVNKSYFVILMAIGVTFPLITGGVDLSIGTGLICYALAGGYLIVNKGWPTWAGMLVAVIFGCVVGLINGLLIAVMELPPFLATLCTCMMTRGLGSICAHNFGISWPSSGDGSWFRSIFKITVEKKVIPLGFVWILLLVVIMAFVLNHTKVGRYTFAIGSNKEATRLSGVNVKLYQVIAYVLSGLFAGRAAIAYAATFPTVQPGTGAGFELEAIGGAIIGGVSATGGAGSIEGTLLGVLVICILKTGLPFVGLQANWQQIITGAVLIGAVLIDIIKKKRKTK